MHVCFYDIIEEFEASIGITHLGYNRIINLWNNLRFNSFSEDFGDAVNNILVENNMNAEYWNKEFKNLYSRAWKKLDTIIKDYESIDFLKAVRVL